MIDKKEKILIVRIGRMKKGKNAWILKGILIAGLIWSWMPVWVVRDGTEREREGE